MSISQTYCDFATGNDYKGATFIDGAYTSATKTLVKAGAFAASKVNHWLYLSDNGSGEVAPGYYRITSVTSADAVVLHADIRSGANDPTDVVCTQHDGTTTLPWRSVQGALDLIAQGNNGNQVNIKSGSVNLAVAQIVFTTYGVPTGTRPVVFRGYDAVANDGGTGELRTDIGETMFAKTTDIHFVDMILSGTKSGNFFLLTLGGRSSLLRSSLDMAAAEGGVITQAVLADAPFTMIGCDVGECSGGYGIYCVGLWGASTILYNYIRHTGVTGSTAVIPSQYGGGTVKGNIIVLSQVGAGTGINSVYGNMIEGNIVYSVQASHGAGVSASGGVVVNNIIMGFSGIDGKAIKGRANCIGHNAFYNNTTDVNLTQAILDLTANDVQLLADPFTDAANGDFSLTDAAKAVLADAGWPQSYLGAHVNTDPHITIGAIQQALATGGGGFPKIASVLGRTRM